MSWTLCTSGSAILKASVNANATMTGYTGVYKTFLDLMSDEAESEACNLARSNVIANYASLTTNGKQVLQTLTSARIAQKIIGYDPDAIGRSTSIAILNILENDINNAKQILMEDKNRTYLGIVV